MSSEAYNRWLAQRVRLNRQILENKYWCLPVDDKGHEAFTPVGRGDRSSDFCGKHVSLAVCKNVDGHEGVSAGGVDCSGKVVVRHKHMWCHKATCPVCFIRGWSVRGARSIAGRLEAGVERDFGQIEHVVVSISPDDYDLSEKVFRKRARQALSGLGVAGGCMIFHGYRIDRGRGVLVWKPHYHSLAFIEEGYTRCRDCERKWNCLKGCGEFDDRSWQQYLKDGYYVKVLAERKTVFGSAWYQLNHATVRVSFLRRFHTVTYWGVCGNRKYGSVKVKAEDVCLACGEEMVKCAHVGKRVIARNIGNANYRSVFVDDEFDENGEENYPELVGGREYG